MPSPFPGMDPWLEAPGLFPDLHTRFLTGLSAALNAVLPPPFYAGVSTRVWLEESDRRVEPDVDVLRPSNGHPAAAGGGGVAVAAWPTAGLLEVVAPAADEERREAYVDIFAAPGGDRLVASVEVLSPSNKAVGSRGRDLYRAKQEELRRAGVHLVEVDLLRRGAHATLVPEAALRARAGAFDYHACIHRADVPDSFFVAPVRLADRLPTVPIPLTAAVPAVPADLQAVLDRCYDVGLYGRRVRYDRPPDPPLSPDQAGWAAGVLRSKGLTPPSEG